MNNLEPLERLLERMQRQVYSSYAELRNSRDRVILLEVKHEAEESFLLELEAAVKTAKGEQE